MAFHPGQEIICVDGGSHDGGYGDEALPVRGRFYTVRKAPTEDHPQGIHLVELVNRPRSYREGYYECAFDPRRFRHLQKEDISIFTSMLTKPPAKTKRERA